MQCPKVARLFELVESAATGTSKRKKKKKLDLKKKERMNRDMNRLTNSETGAYVRYKQDH
jgi:hypothetical protein